MSDRTGVEGRSTDAPQYVPSPADLETQAGDVRDPARFRALGVRIPDSSRTACRASPKVAELLVTEALPYVDELQVADVPSRREPGTGEIHFPAVAAALHDLGYTGVIELEGWASGDDDSAVDTFRDTFTPNTGLPVSRISESDPHD